MTSAQSTGQSARPSRWLGQVVAAVIALIVAGMVAGCSRGGVAKKTMTAAQATARAQTILRDIAAALNPRPTLEVNQLLTVTDQCVADVPNADKMVNVAYSYWLRGIPASQFGNIGRQIKAYLEKRGYTIKTSGGFSSGQPGISGYTSDSFLISLDWSAKGALSIGASSPCIYRDGTPP